MRAGTRSKIGKILCEMGYLNRNQLKAALREQKRREGYKLGGILIELGIVSVSQLNEALTLQLKQAYLNREKLLR